ncbi:MAG: rod shape-determining protein MreC [Candidatus Moranbacteria bacterium]|nr:rod shape-determining protein MreC [Candidatus Moranbacteria bacterium]
MPKKYFTSKIVKLVVTMIICALLIFFNPSGIMNPVRGIFLTVALPFQKVFYGASQKIGETAAFLTSISEIKKDNAELSRENNSLVAQVASLQEEKNQNASLREQLGLIPKNKFSLAGGFVIGQDPAGSEGWVVFDKGEKDGISAGMAVIVDNGILVGKVDEVYATSSKISLLTNPSSAINVTDVETGAKGIIRGEYGLGLVMDMVTQADVLNVGDTIITSGLGSNIPRGLLVGKVKEVKVSDDRLFQKAVVVSRVKYSNLDTVFVIK